MSKRKDVMGVIVNKNQEDTKIGARVTADLRNRVQSTSDEDTPDFAENNEYTKDLKKTSRFGWVWLVLIVLAIASLVVIILL